jgi:hypothetical protein
MLGEARAIICPVQLFATKSMQSEVAARTKRPVISRHFSTCGATFDTRQRIFDLMVFALVESRFPKARKATQKPILQLAVWERTHHMNAWSNSTIS